MHTLSFKDDNRQHFAKPVTLGIRGFEDFKYIQDLENQNQIEIYQIRYHKTFPFVLAWRDSFPFVGYTLQILA